MSASVLPGSRDVIGNGIYPRSSPIDTPDGRQNHTNVALLMSHLRCISTMTVYLSSNTWHEHKLLLSGGRTTSFANHSTLWQDQQATLDRMDPGIPNEELGWSPEVRSGCHSHRKRNSVWDQEVVCCALKVAGSIRAGQCKRGSTNSGGKSISARCLSR